MKTLRSLVTGAMLRHQAGRQMFCGHPDCGVVLDAARAVSVDFFKGRKLADTRMYCADCHDANRALIVRVAKEHGHTAKFCDGRLLDAHDRVRTAVRFRICIRMSAMVATNPEGNRRKKVVWKRVAGRRVKFLGADVPEVVTRQDWIVHQSARGQQVTVTHVRSGLAAAHATTLRGALLTAVGRFLRAEPDRLDALFQSAVEAPPAE